MDKKYKTIDFMVRNNIESAVNELIGYREQGLLVCGSFNGITLYSDTVTMDGAYKEITGKTKAEFDNYKQECRNNYEREERKHKERIPELILEWQKEGRKVLAKDKWELWDEIIPIRLADLYQGMELSCCLDIVKILNNNGTLDEAKAKIESQDHSGMSFRLVCAMVKKFSQRGEEFINYVK